MAEVAGDEALDLEIEALQARAQALKDQVSVYAINLLTQPAVHQAIDTPSATITPQSRLRLKERLDKQDAHNQQCLYRMCAGITTFRVQDPDPNAVDGGVVLGVRIDIMTRAKFMPQPYYVFLNRPYGSKTNLGRRRVAEHGKRWLRVHRHTVPPCIPLAALAARYLPSPASPSTNTLVSDKRRDMSEYAQGQEQDLGQFARCLRRELVRYHNRDAIVRDLRKKLKLDDTTEQGGDALDQNENAITSISSADAAVKQVQIDWADGRSGRLIIDDDGVVTKLVVLNAKGRRTHMSLGDAIAQDLRMEDAAKTLADAT